MKLTISMLLGLSLLASTALAQNSFKALNCAEADLTASPYTTFQVQRIAGGKVSLAYHTTAFFGSEEFSKPVFSEYLDKDSSSTVTSQPESKNTAGGFYIEWGGGDAAYLDISRAKSVKGTGSNKKVTKAKNYTGVISFPNGQGPKHLQDGGTVKVTCGAAQWPWSNK